MLREFIPQGFGLEEGFKLMKSADFLYLLYKDHPKVIATFTHNVGPRELMRECGRYLQTQKRAGLL